MGYASAIVLPQIATTQAGHDVIANAILAALSPAAIFGVYAEDGLSLTMYGGPFLISGTPTILAAQTVTLTDNATNYVKASSSGVVSVVTSAPSGWPGPLASSAIALYQLTTSSGQVTGGTCYRTGVGPTGATGATGAQGAAGSEFATTRKRVFEPVGAGITTTTQLGFNSATVASGTATAVSLATTNLRTTIPYLSYVTSASAGNSAQIYNQNFCYFGDASGRGGFTVSFRFMMESGNSPANQRTFIGLYDRATGTLGNAEPDTLTNIFGIAAKAGDASFSIIHNDASGTATMSSLGSNFPARATDNVYELTLSSVANSSVVSYVLTNINSGQQASGSFSSDIPANTVFFTWIVWTNNGSTASAASIGIAQIVGETRY